MQENREVVQQSRLSLLLDDLRKGLQVNPDDLWVLDNMKIEIMVFPDAVERNFQERKKAEKADRF